MFVYRDMGPMDKDSVGLRVTGLKVGVVSLHLSAVGGHGRAISSSHNNKFTLHSNCSPVNLFWQLEVCDRLA